MKRRAEEDPISFSEVYKVPTNKLKQIYTLAYICKSYKHKDVHLVHKDGTFYRELFGFIPGGVYFNYEKLNILRDVFEELNLFKTKNLKNFYQCLLGLEGQIIRVGKYYGILSPYLQLHLPEAMPFVKTNSKKIVGITVNANIIGPAYASIPFSFLTYSPIEDIEFENLKWEGIKYMTWFNTDYCELVRENLAKVAVAKEATVHNKAVLKEAKRMSGLKIKISQAAKIAEAPIDKPLTRIIVSEFKEIKITKEFLSETFENIKFPEYDTVLFELDSDKYFEGFKDIKDAPWLSLKPGTWGEVSSDVELETLHNIFKSVRIGTIGLLEDIDVPEEFKDVRSGEDGINITITGFDTKFMERIPGVNEDSWSNVSYMFSFLVNLIDEIQQ